MKIIKTAKYIKLADNADEALEKLLNWLAGGKYEEDEDIPEGGITTAQRQRVPGATRGRKPGTTGLVNSKVFIEGVKELAAKGYTIGQIKDEMSERMGRSVSWQTVSRTIVYQNLDYAPKGKKQDPMKNILNYVAFEFWGTYKSGIATKLESIPPNERGQFMSNFIDEIFETPKDAQAGKEALFHKTKIRNLLNESTPQRFRRPTGAGYPQPGQMPVNEPANVDWQQTMKPRIEQPQSTQGQDDIDLQSQIQQAINNLMQQGMSRQEAEQHMQQRLTGVLQKVKLPENYKPKLPAVAANSRLRQAKY